MKRNTIALILVLSMCLSLLSACSSGDTAADGKSPESENAVSSTEQQPEESEKTEESKEQPEESEKPREESPEPAQEEHEGTKLLALLQEEWNNGVLVEGERPGCTYYKIQNWQTSDFPVFIRNGVVCIWDELNGVFTYDIAAKKLSKNEPIGNDPYVPVFVMNDNIIGYYINHMTTGAFDYNGVCQKTVAGGYQWHFDTGILLWNDSDKTRDFYSYDLEKIAEIPTTVQLEAAHGLKEDVVVDLRFPYGVIANGTIYGYADAGKNSAFYQLNMDTYEWEKSEFALKDEHLLDRDKYLSVCGKYVTKGSGIYDWDTLEQVFECGELYSPAANHSKELCYFGGDKYLGYNKGEYRWVYLTDLSMSDPLPFPEPEGQYKLYVLNDTYCAYRDKYGWFLWNYNTGEEETIVMFEQ